jgi:hypothetical protein
MTPDAIIDQAVNSASAMRDGAKTEIETAIRKLGYPMTLGYGTMVVNQINSDFVLPDVPLYAGQHYKAPEKTFGAAPAMDPVPAMELGAEPTLTATAPTYIEPVRPAELRAFDKTAPTLESFTVPPSPDALSNFDFAIPTVSDITIPPAPSVVLPEFAATAPDTAIAAPSDLSGEFASNYAGMSVSMRNSLDAAVDAQLLKINPEYHNQMAALEAKLSKYMAGGTALPIDVEQAIYNRARDKTNAEYLKSRDQIMKEGASRGFTIPGGAQYSALAQSRQAAADNNARAAMDIAIKQAEMEQQNIQFAMAQSANLRVAVVGALNAWFGSLIQLNGQALEYARDLLQAAISVYEVAVKIATARIEIYKAEAQVYEIRLKAVLAVYDVYMAEIKALEAQVNIEVSRINAVRSRAEALAALASAYRATIDGVVARAQLEKLKVDIFGEEIRAFSAEASAKQVEWQGFGEQVRGEVAKQGVYEAQVRAYSEEWRAQVAKIQGYSSHVQAITAKNEGAYRTYGAAVQAYTALISGESEAVRADVAVHDADVKGFIARASAEEARVKSKIAGYEATIRNSIGLYNTNANIAIASSSNYNHYMTSAAGVAVNAAQVYASMAGSAMAGISALGATIATTTG